MDRKNEFNDILFRWWRRNRRNLPWRKTKDPYRILVSEVMLQQTQVERVIPKYKDFLKGFPTVRALAGQSLGAVLRIWLGLGYNRRAKYLWQCAQAITRQYGGKFPQTFDALRGLPGIGRSTAAALLAFAFGQDEPMIDTNIRRILVRVFFPGRLPGDAGLYRFAKALIPKGKGKAWNWAMMDVGALVCTAKRHNPACPFQALHCDVEDFQYKKPQSRFKDSRRYWRGRVLFHLAQRPAGYSGHILRLKLGLEAKDFNALVETLKKERLVESFGTKLCLPRNL